MAIQDPLGTITTSGPTQDVEGTDDYTAPRGIYVQFSDFPCLQGF